MAYFNFQRAYNKFNMTPLDVLVMQLIHQNSNTKEDTTDMVATYLTDEFKKFLEENEYSKNLKNKKLNDIERIRLTKKGRKLLNDLQKRGSFEKEDEVIAEWIEGVYKKRDNYVKSNLTELKRRVQWFREETGINRNKLATLVQLFLNDTFIQDEDKREPFEKQYREFKQENPRAVLSLKAENIMWTPPDRYAKYYQLEDSPLYQYYLENEEYVEKHWKNL